MILVKDQGQPIYLLSKNPQIRLWYRKLGYASNARVIEESKLNNGIDITIEDNFPTEDLAFNSEIDDEDECNDLGQTFITNN